jgi:hypothetical protein
MNRIMKSARSLVRKSPFTSRISGGVITLVCFAIAFLTPIAQAQYRTSIAEINVPFAFECGSQLYPAGIYNIRKWGQEVLLISGSSRSGFVMLHTELKVRAAEKGAAVFRVTGNRRFLHEIRSKGDRTVFVFYPSRAEQEIESASNSIHQPDIQLALLNALQ